MDILLTWHWAQTLTFFMDGASNACYSVDLKWLSLSWSVYVQCNVARICSGIKRKKRFSGRELFSSVLRGIFSLTYYMDIYVGFCSMMDSGYTHRNMEPTFHLYWGWRIYAFFGELTKNISKLKLFSSMMWLEFHVISSQFLRPFSVNSHTRGIYFPSKTLP